ncbi:MAG: hypothetical protein TR69_WS6001000993 [candidate division WS6 bacterium OLB20]|uniref:Uncharacterized protein n=1 Tax=candidate division WS6 bacterium OLB20 TaxID=1617426 RepID=A0A136LZ86_9BACT|nr:MAG: hypothetical protein TR69_WS6001000993 [candidate division WS6 bacterium OLB20]
MMLMIPAIYGPLAVAASGNGSILTALPFIISRRNRRPWGLVFDSKRKLPVAFAVLRFRQGETIVQEVVTDLEGRYAAALEAGQYSVEVAHDEYQNINDVITLEDNAQVERNFAMSPSGDKSTAGMLDDIRSRVNAITRPVFAVGFAFSATVTVLFPTLLNFIILGVYILSGAVYLYRLWIESNYSGVVVDMRGNPVHGAILRFLDKDLATVDVIMTNKQGRFSYATIRNRFASIGVFADGLEVKRPHTHNERIGDIVEHTSDKHNRSIRITMKPVSQRAPKIISVDVS